ncbi:MAG: TIGR00296 family protein [Thermoplasmata archaeon]
MNNPGLSIDLDIGKKAVQIARLAIESYIRSNETITAPREGIFSQNHGIFTTIETYPQKVLRGCIGFPEPYYTLGEGLVKSAIYAATEDPRFERIRGDELDKITVEVSILTEPTEIESDPEKRPENISIGKDGIIAVYNGASGLLLPQVATEYHMNSKEFLESLCEKAGLWEGCWKYKKVKISKFQAVIFGEKSPRGEVEQR